MNNKEDIRKDNDRKKKYLWSYKKIRDKAERAGLDINEFRLSKICPSVFQDGMPKGNSKSDLSVYMSKLDGLEKKYMDLKSEELDVRMDIRNKIELLEDDNEKQILDMRYLRLMEWMDIYKQIGFSKSQVHRIHGRALRNIII